MRALVPRWRVAPAARAANAIFIVLFTYPVLNDMVATLGGLATEYKGGGKIIKTDIEKP